MMSQVEKNSLGHIGIGGGFKNPYGSWGVFYSRAIDSSAFEIKLGVGKRQSPCLMGGVNFRLFQNNKNFECF